MCIVCGGGGWLVNILTVSLKSYLRKLVLPSLQITATASALRCRSVYEHVPPTAHEQARSNSQLGLRVGQAREVTKASDATCCFFSLRSKISKGTAAHGYK